MSTRISPSATSPSQLNIYPRSNRKGLLWRINVSQIDTYEKRFLSSKRLKTISFQIFRVIRTNRLFIREVGLSPYWENLLRIWAESRDQSVRASGLIIETSNVREIWVEVWSIQRLLNREWGFDNKHLVEWFFPENVVFPKICPLFEIEKQILNRRLQIVAL